VWAVLAAGMRSCRSLLAAALILLAVPSSAQAVQHWYAPINVNGTTAFGADIGVDSSGQAVAVYVDDGPKDLVEATIRLAGENLSYGAPQTLSAANKNGFEPKVAVAANGAALAVWTNTTDTTVQAAFKPAASNTFGGAVTLSAAGSFRPDVAIDPQDNATAIWVRQTGATSIIESSTRSAATGTFSAPEQLSESGFLSDNAQVAAEQNGEASAAWTKFIGGGGSLAEASARREQNYPRPASGTPFRVPLVPAYNECTAPNSTHVAPLALAACTSPTLTSTILTMGSAGAGSGFLRYKALPGDGVVPPDNADIDITVSLTDVRCAVAPVTGCTLAGGDYSGQLVAGTTLQMTDTANGVFGDDPGTASLGTFSFPMNCTPTGGANGSICSVSTTADTLVPNIAKENKKTIFSLESVQVTDLGADGTMSPGGGASCPPTCGSGDEKVFADEGVVAP
jgi:hypothetical protein